MSRRRKFTFPILMTTVLGGGGALNISNPATDTFYTASADGTFTLELTQPGSTNPLTRIGFYYRATTSADAWFYYVERNQANTAWDLKRSLIQSGTPTVTTITTGLGTVAALRVTVSGTSHVFESSADGESWTSRGSTTSAVHQTNNKVAAHYTGAAGDELYTTANAASISNEANATTGVSGNVALSVESSDVQNGSYAIHAQGTSVGSFQRAIYDLAAYEGIEVVAQIYVKAAVGSADQRLAWINFGAAGTVFVNITAAYALYARRDTLVAGANISGYATYGVSNSTNVQLTDALSIKAVAALDDGGTTGPTRLYVS